MTRRAWASIVIAVAVTACVAAAAFALDPSGASSAGSAVASGHRGGHRVRRSAHDAEGALTAGRHRSTTVRESSSVAAEAALPAAPPPTAVSLASGTSAPVLSRVPTPNRVIFLGIDDGIVRDPNVLAYLQQAHFPFTVFLVKPYAQAGLAYWRAMQAAGGTIESHTITHPDLTKVGYSRARTEICGTLDPYQQWFGRRPTLFRAPYGAYDATVRQIVAKCGFKAMIQWEGSTNDGRLDLQDATLHPGDVLLMHWRTDLLENLHVVVAACRAQGFTIARLEDYLSPGT